MVHWFWVLLSFFLGGWVGIIIMSCLIAAKRADERIREG